MEFRPDPKLALFRQEVRQFLQEKLPPELTSRFHGFRSSREQVVAWQTILHAQGWGAPYWATEHGGTGWTTQQQQVFDAECSMAGAPTLDLFGHKLIGPALNEFGTAGQKAEHAARIVTGERLWCQGFSEPGSGSDLASLRCRAELDGEHYVVNGQKIWTSYAHQADWIFLLVRTDTEARKQAGISFLLLDMKSGGISTRPIISIDDRHHLNEVFFDNARALVADRVGGEGDGWKITKFLLNNEHASTADLPALEGYLRRLKELGARLRLGDGPLGAQQGFRLRLARFEAEVNAMSMMVARVAAMEQARDHSPAAHALGSMLKLRGTELQKAMSEFLVESIGDDGAIAYPACGDAATEPLPRGDVVGDIASDAFFRRASTIYGGSSEIQRGIVAKLSFNF